MKIAGVFALKYRRNSASGFFAIGLSVFLSSLIIGGYFSLQLYVNQAQKSLVRMAAAGKADSEAKNALNVASVIMANNLMSFDQGKFQVVGGGPTFGWTLTVPTPPQ